MTSLNNALKIRDITFLIKILYSQSYGFSSRWYGCDSWNRKKAEHKELMLSNCGAGEKTLESPLDTKEIKPVSPKGNQPWIFIGRADAEASILWPPDVKSWLIGKDPNAGKDWRKEKGTTEDEMVGWHHRLNGHEFEQAPGVGEGQGSLACCSPWGHKESDMIVWLNWTDSTGASLVAQMVKNLPALQETGFRSLCQKDPN